jgi:Rhodopirellula transposase.
LQDATAGDPITGLKWARKTLRALERVLRCKGFKVGFVTLRRSLRERGYAIRVNRKRLTKKHDPERDRQMRYLVRLRRRFLKAGQPVISVDTKKRELIGNFKNAGGTWRQQAHVVLEYDFPSDAEGVAIHRSPSPSSVSLAVTPPHHSNRRYNCCKTTWALPLR